ncbi:MAG: hypothetical protein ACO37Y_07450 [Steroidobacteraceae bacterium]
MNSTSSIRLSTLSDLSRLGYQLACFCPRCQRWADLNLSDLERQGVATRRVVDFTPRCRRCGTRGEKQLRPPRKRAPRGARATFAHYAAPADA